MVPDVVGTSQLRRYQHGWLVKVLLSEIICLSSTSWYLNVIYSISPVLVSHFFTLLKVKYNLYSSGLLLCSKLQVSTTLLFCNMATSDGIKVLFVLFVSSWRIMKGFVGDVWGGRGR